MVRMDRGIKVCGTMVKTINIYIIYIINHKTDMLIYNQKLMLLCLNSPSYHDCHHSSMGGMEKGRVGQIHK